MVFAAFENTIKFQYLSSNLSNYKNSTLPFQNSVSCSIKIPFGKPFIKIATIKYSHPISNSNGNYEIYVSTSGDKLYRENMDENKFDFPLHHKYNFAVLINSYLVAIKNYSTEFNLTAGFQLKYLAIE
tara:strand:- start:57 stop:440 length:384 start_codon:yes stop_codon:yes gene_type:complete